MERLVSSGNLPGGVGLKAMDSRRSTNWDGVACEVWTPFPHDQTGNPGWDTRWWFLIQYVWQGIQDFPETIGTHTVRAGVGLKALDYRRSSWYAETSSSGYGSFSLPLLWRADGSDGVLYRLACSVRQSVIQGVHDRKGSPPIWKGAGGDGHIEWFGSVRWLLLWWLWVS